MKIKRWIRDGYEGMAGVDTTELLLEQAGRAMDNAGVHEILGNIAFEGEDGRFFVGTVEFLISEANPEYIRDLQAEDELMAPSDSLVPDGDTRPDDDIENPGLPGSFS